MVCEFRMRYAIIKLPASFTSLCAKSHAQHTMSLRLSHILNDSGSFKARGVTCSYHMEGLWMLQPCVMSLCSSGKSVFSSFSTIRDTSSAFHNTLIPLKYLQLCLLLNERTS